MKVAEFTVGLVTCAGLVPAGLRWLRVLQREHYLAGATTQFALRWTRARLVNVGLAMIAVAATVAAFVVPWCAPIVAIVAVWFPLGLSIKGRTSTLAWTRRLRTVGAAALVLAIVVVAIGAVVGEPAGAAALAVLVVPILIDASAFIVAPYERKLAKGFVDQARRRLDRVAPRIVGITGSFGKTSTKNHIVQLVAGSVALVATPASFNNTAGLARSINERLEDGTEVFVAEMGTYGVGEIAAMCAWCPPDISVLTAIGPVHLERFGSLEVTLQAKAEITASASVVIVNADDARLAAFATSLEGQGVRVVRCSGSTKDADIAVLADGAFATVVLRGQRFDAVPLGPGVQPTNVACALAVSLELGVDPDELARRVGQVTTAANRLTMATSASDAVVIDDTYNANPSGAKAALALLVSTERPELVVVTPGMIELGPQQYEENESFGRAIAHAGATLVIVGTTNKAALVRGARRERGTVVEVATRDDAVAYVKSHAGARHAVLYENDLPDHYP